jgi:KaiC/GvpD/RAD55 family RecA-like ATPase
VALSNAQRQARWRAKRDRLAAQAISEDDSDRDIVRKIVHAIGIKRARVLVRSMDRMTTKPAKMKGSK